MARRTKPRRYAATLAERGELTNLRAIGQAMAREIRDREQGGKGNDLLR